MANLTYLLLLLRLSSFALGQNASSVASAVSSSASVIASSANGAASSASSLASVGSSSAASSLSSIASQESSIASSLSSVASSLSSVASTIASSTPATSTSSSSSSITTTTTETSISVASPSSSSLSSSSTTSTSDSESSIGSTTGSSLLSVASTSESSLTSTTATSSSSSSSPSPSPVILSSTSTSVSFSSSTIISTDVLPTTSDGVVGYTTLTTYIVSSAPATTYVNVSPYTTSQLPPGSNPTTQAGADNSGGGGGLSSGAKIGIGVGIGLAVLAAAIFGGWYSWYMRRRRRRSISGSDRYPPSSLPSMTGMMMGGGAYGEKSDIRSELPSPPIGGPMGDRPSPPPRSPDRLIPRGAGVRSWNSVSNSNVPASSQSVSDYSERGGQHPSELGENMGQPQPQPGYFPPGGAIHEMPENQQHQYHHQQGQYQQQHPHQQFAHSRTVSGESQPSELGEQTLPPQHQRTVSGESQHYQQPTMGTDGYWHDPQNAQELQGSPSYLQQTTSRGEGYRGVDPEVPLHQRMQNERIPIRPGHLQKSPPTNLGPSHNY